MDEVLVTYSKVGPKLQFCVHEDDLGSDWGGGGGMF